MNSDSDDDMPPPLEDMSEQIKANKTMKEEAMGKVYGKSDDHVEEVRLAPKKQSAASASTEGQKQGLAPKDDNFDFDTKKSNQAPKTAEAVSTQKVVEQPKQAPPQKKQKKNDGFGGFAAGFLNGPPPKKKKPAVAPVKKVEKKVEVED